jgi:hypothetical protein
MAIHKPIATTPENLKAIAEQLQRCAADLSAVAESVSDAHLEDPLMVTNFGQLKNAVKFSNNFLSAARDALWQAKEKRGDFGTLEHANGTATRVRKLKRKPEK